MNQSGHRESERESESCLFGSQLSETNDKWIQKHENTTIRETLWVRRTWTWYQDDWIKNIKCVRFSW